MKGLKCKCGSENLKVRVSYDGCDWNCKAGEDSGFVWTVDLECEDCCRIYSIIRALDSRYLSEVVE